MKKLKVYAVALAAMLALGSQAQQLSEEQSAKLREISQGVAQHTLQFDGALQNKMTELALELQREGRLDSEASAKKAAKTVNAIVTDLGKLYGEFIKTKVKFVLEAKNVLTEEQKLLLLSQLSPDSSLPYETIEYLQPDVFDLPLNLTIKQEKKLIAIETKMLVKEVELESAVELVLLDLREIMISGEAQPEKVDPLVMKLADLAAKSIDNRVSFFLKSKDVLTLDQKRVLSHMLDLN